MKLQRGPFGEYCSALIEATRTIELPQTEIAGSKAAFDAMSEHIHVKTLEVGEQTLPEILKKDQVRHGIKVIGRFAFFAALSACSQELSVDETETSLLHAMTFAQTLGVLATTDNEVAKRVERSYGLWAEPDDPDLTASRYYFKEDGSIELLDLEEEIHDIRETEITKGTLLKKEPMCPAHRASALEPIYRSIIPVFTRTPTLVPATISATYDQQRDSILAI